MSRTDKDRPYWVKLNDPGSPRYPYHQHHVNLYEWCSDTGLARRWSEGVECTLDRAEEGPYTWRFRSGRLVDVDRDRKAKLCGYQLNYGGDYPSSKGWKSLSNRATRHAINIKLNQAKYLNSNYLYDEIDIYDDSKYNFTDWWD